MVESKINVTVRIKPLKQKEQVNDKNKNLWHRINEQGLMNMRTKEVYTFDRVFGPETSTEIIFNEQVKNLVHNALDGINQTVFAYGQTSSGKTFTMRGCSLKGHTGLIPLSIKEIFDTIERDTDHSYKVSVSYMEVSKVSNFGKHKIKGTKNYPMHSRVGPLDPKSS